MPTRFGATLRCWVGNFLVLVAFLGLISTSTIRNADLGIVMTSLLVAGALIVTTLVGLTGRRLAMTGRKQRAGIAAHVRANDPRAPVLYLRSFADDEVVAEANIVRGFIQLSTEEEQFAKVLNRIGPFLAIGDPRETLPDLGATRLYVSDHDWKRNVEELLAKARLVVLRLSATESLLWELQVAFARLEPSRLLLLVPLGSDRYESFRTLANLWLPKPLPNLPKQRTIIGSLQAIVRFRDDWTPEFLPTSFSILRVSMRPPIAPHLQMMLHPVFDELRVPWSKPRLGTLPIVFLVFMSIFLCWVAAAMLLDH
jgi:hypothetical protein